MTTLLAIADDLTGAAEIAGIGLRHGLPTRLLRAPKHDCFAGLTVVDTDSRPLAPAAAGAAVTRALEGMNLDGVDLVYKKIDSVLRGPVLFEVRAALAALGLGRAILVPQNPSRGRTVEGGIYRIGGVPLDRTEFALDPEYPAHTAVVRDRVGLAPGDDSVGIADASTLGDLESTAAASGDATLPVGGADFFTAILQLSGLRPVRLPRVRMKPGLTLFICGSASSQRDRLIESARQQRVAVCPMPPELLAAAHAPAAAVGRWVDETLHALAASERCIMTILGPRDSRPGAPLRLQSVLATAAHRVIEQTAVANLLMEGGATASAVCREMEWNAFAVTGELATGVVQLRASTAGPLIIVKPGSYQWPDGVWE